MKETKKKLPGPLLGLRKITTVLIFTLPFLVLPGCSSKTAPMNLILITVDTLRPDLLGCYGYPLPTSPAVDHFASQAIVFEDAYAQAASTRPSLAALMTSRMPVEAGVRHNMDRLPEGIPTLAEVLAKNGFTTAAFVSNFVIKKWTGFERGFDLYDDTMTSRSTNRYLFERGATETTQSSLAWLETRPKEPFFLWLHYQDPHGPYIPPPPYKDLFFEEIDVAEKEIPLNESNSGIDGIPFYQRFRGEKDLKSYIARYLGEIRYFDDAFGRFLDWIDKSQLRSNTIVVFSADHGESLGEHNCFFAHGEYLYEHQIRVPLIIRIPGLPHKRIKHPVALVDLFPSMLNLLRIKVDSGCRGMDLFENTLDGRQIFSQTHRAKYITQDRQMMIWQGYKIIRSGDDEFELYNLLEDPMELLDLKERKPELAKVMEKMLGRYLAGLEPGTVRQAPLEQDDETLKKLKSLGYL